MVIDQNKLKADFETYYNYYCNNIKLTQGKKANIPDKKFAWVFYSKGRMEKSEEAYKQGVADLLKYQMENKK